MLKKYIKFSIIGIVKTVLPVLLILCIAPLLLENTSTFSNWREHFAHFKWFFLFIHTIFYALIFFAWPHLVSLYARKQEKPPNTLQLKLAIKARWYLVGALVVFELLNLLR